MRAHMQWNSLKRDDLNTELTAKASIAHYRIQDLNSRLGTQIQVLDHKPSLIVYM